MKQFISGEQIYEESVSFKQFEHLRELLDMDDGTFGERCNIGKMIEILERYRWLLKITQSLEGHWRVELDMVNGRSYYRQELCDALWMAVKSCL